MNDEATPLIEPPVQRPIPFGLDYGTMTFEPLTIDFPPDTLHSMLSELEEVTGRNQAEEVLIYEAALALYEKMKDEPAWDHFDRAELFMLCLHTALIWDRG